MADVAVTTITDPSGHDWVLDGSAGIWLGKGKAGFHAPTYAHFFDEPPLLDGAVWRGVRATTRTLTLPIAIVAADRDVLVATRRALIRAISPRRGQCVISSAYPDGSVRRIKARYLDGMEGTEGGVDGIVRATYGLRFIAEDPHMYGDPIASSWSTGASSRTELPIPGADTFFEVVSSPLITGGVTITNPGDVDAYPVWTFSGPFTSIVAANNTTGKSWTVTYTAAGTGNSIVVTTTPGNTSVVDETGTNRWATLTAGYSLWPLISGDNMVTFTVAGATGSSLATMSYMPRYEAA